MARLTLIAVLVLVLAYTEARPYYYGYHVPWYPVSPCNPYPPPCSPYPYPCGAPQPPKPTPCNPQPRPPMQPPPNQQTAEEALLTQDINVRPVRQGIMNPYGVEPPRPRPRPARPLRKIPRYPGYIGNPQDPYNPVHEYRALKRRPYRRRFRGGRRMYDEGEDYDGYGHHDEPEDAQDYNGDDYEEDGMAQGVYRDDPMDPMEEYDHGDYENDSVEADY